MIRILLLLTILSLLIAPSLSVSANSTEQRTAGTGTNDDTVGTIAWTNPGNITADDGSVATCSLSGGGAESNRLKATNFGFSIPSAATVLGIEAVIQRRQQSGTTIQDIAQGVQLLKANNPAGTGKADGGTWSTTMTNISYGGAADLWGTTWTSAEVNDSGFGVSLRAVDFSAESVAEVDVMTITVTFVVPYIPRRTVKWGDDLFASVQTQRHAASRVSMIRVSVDSTSSSIPSSVTQERIEPSSKWRNITNAMEEDGKYATSSVTQGMPTLVLRLTGFGFNTPVNATVEGVIVEIRKRAESSSISDSMIKLIKGGVISGRQHCECSVGWPVMQAEWRTHGAAKDLWGLDNDGQKLTPRDVNSPGFGVAIAAWNTEAEYAQREAGIDAVRMTIHYRQQRAPTL